MTVRKETRAGQTRWVIDIPYRTSDGKPKRYRRDAQVQTKTAAHAEDRRLYAELGQSGSLPGAGEKPEPEPEPHRYTFAEAVRHYRATHMKTTLKPATRASYENRITMLLVPRFGDLPLEAVDRAAMTELDVELAEDELLPSTRAKVQIVVRSILRNAVRAGMLPTMPAMPPLPRVGRKVPNPMRREDLDAILAVSSPSARLACELAALAGLRASEVRGLRWSDVDLKVGTLTIRRGITLGIETTPKSHHQRLIPLARTLRATLERAVSERRGPWAPVSLTAFGKPWGESGLNQAFQRAQERAGRSGWTFHDLRRFFVTELFRNGAPAPAVQLLAGHADLTTTQRYADLDANAPASSGAHRRQ